MDEILVYNRHCHSQFGVMKKMPCKGEALNLPSEKNLLKAYYLREGMRHLKMLEKRYVQFPKV